MIFTFEVKLEGQEAIGDGMFSAVMAGLVWKENKIDGKANETKKIEIVTEEMSSRALQYYS